MRAVALLLLLVTACGQKTDAPARREGTVKWRTAYSAAECKALAANEAVVKRCFGGNLENGQYVGDRQCWPFSEPRRLRGIWLIDLEASLFYPNVSAFSETKDDGWAWLESDLLEARPELLAAAQGAGRRVYAVQVEGREALCDGDFGHLGMYPRQVIAERFYSMRPLPAN